MPVTLAIQEVEMGGVGFKASPGKKSVRLHLTLQKMVVYACYPSYSGRVRRIMAQACLGYKKDTLFQK
jgi:hypothetical protein